MTEMLKLGTRGSPLALVQARLVAAALAAAHGWREDAVEIVTVVTTGDRVQDRPLAEIGGKALWTKELDAALLDGRVDLAVHSMKDVETELAAGVVLGPMLPRADVRDRLIGATSIDALPHSARLGTSSPRRAAQLLALRPDLLVSMLRGNVATRLARVANRDIDATLLAAAGLARLGHDVGTPIPIETMLPAASQGAVGTTLRARDTATAALLAAIDDAPTSQAVRLERDLLAALGADCHSPVAALATIDGAMVHMRAELLAPDGRERVCDSFAEPLDAAPAAVRALAARLLAAASPDLAARFNH
ncbi:hydroxymethylbilane synthase [Polymorphobacter arshaanensis]|uniref:Hydroxymethylbilane synthase n=1 Tax=Glacieibacterium arshaanense TaxID=2511025 RepID=A0A4Y9EKC8_9SPHN|nr:hydroxymethylbilane synthase [Polymorphobacter arshaanensis]TFU01252.1 hydroxymethylbilane synthase [Polymorphobacter arshaanensis]